MRERPLPMNRVRFRFLCVGHALDHLFIMLFPTVVLWLEDYFSQTYSELLWLAIPGSVAFAAGAIPAGWLGDRWSRSGMMVIFFIGIGAASILTGFAESQLEISVGLFFIGLFASIYHPVGVAMVVQGQDKIGRLLGINGVWGNFGLAAAAFLATALSDWFSWRFAFFVPGGVAILVGMLYFWMSRSWPVSDRIAGEKKHDIRSVGSMSRVARQALWRVVVVLTMGALLAGIVFQTSTIVLPKVFEEGLGDLISSPLFGGGMVTLVVGIASFSQIVAGQLIDKFSIKQVWITILFLQVPLLILVGIFSQTGLLIAAFAALLIVFGEIPIQDALLARHTPEHLRSRLYGLKFSLALGAGALSVAIIASLHPIGGGFISLFGLLAACALVLAAAAFWLPSRPHHLEKCASAEVD